MHPLIDATRSACPSKEALCLFLCLAIPQATYLPDLSAPPPGPPLSQRLLLNDLETQVSSNQHSFIATRYMRHIWMAPGHVLAAAVQKAGVDGEHLVLIKSTNAGQSWETDRVLVADHSKYISDGVMAANGDLYIAASTLLTSHIAAPIQLLKLHYNPAARSWDLSHTSFVAPASLGNRASIAVDSNGIVWCAFRAHEVANSEWFIKVMYSQDDGLTWQDSGREFGTRNSNPQKNPKLLAFNGRLVMISHDAVEGQGPPAHSKKSASRRDTAVATAAWHQGPSIDMLAYDPHGTHWSVANDPQGHVHMSYQDGGITYTKYAGAIGDTWATPVRFTNHLGEYSSISVSWADANAPDVYVFWSFEEHVYLRKYAGVNATWMPYERVSRSAWPGNTRMRISSPAAYDKFLPVLYQVDDVTPRLIYNLLADPN